MDINCPESVIDESLVQIVFVVTNICVSGQQIEKELHTRLLVDGIEMVFVSGEDLCRFCQEYYS
jgi:hypothetical protein